MSEHSEPKPAVPERRSVLRWMLAAVVGGAAAVVAGVPLFRYFLGPLWRRTEDWVRLGPAAHFPVHETRLVTFDNPIRTPWDGMVAHTGVHVRALGEEQFLVFAINCTHLGCPVTWFPQSGLFMCPCHGGVYYENGERASGPPPRGLYHCDWRVKDGQLEIRAPHLPTLQDTLK
jgi:menaquinol-cytochrome c reductase iron-sulfur subunit